MGTNALSYAYTRSLGIVVPQKRNQYRPYILRHSVLTFFSALIVTAKIASVLVIALTPETAFLSTITSAFLIDQANQARREAGLPNLTPNTLLQESARMKAEDMFKYGYFAHNSPSGVSPWKWFNDVEYDYIYAGENLAIDFTTGEGVHEAWMESPGHRKNILNERYSEIGIAVVTGNFEGRTTTIVVQHFGSLTGTVKRPTAPVATPAPTKEPSATKPTQKPTPTPLAPPEIVEPTEGQILPDGAATVRGLAAAGSTVEILLNNEKVGSYISNLGSFEGKFNLPSNTQKDGTIIGITKLGDQKSGTSVERHVKIDTRFPVIPQDGAVFLPEPQGDINSLLLVVPVFGTTKNVIASVDGKTVPLKVDGSVAVGKVDAASTMKLVTVRAEDSLGHVRTTQISPMQQFHVNPGTETENTSKKKASSILDLLRNVFSALIYILALLLAINILIHIKIQHADLIAHGLFVIIMGSLLFLLA